MIVARSSGEPIVAASARSSGSAVVRRHGGRRHASGSSAVGVEHHDRRRASAARRGPRVKRSQEALVLDDRHLGPAVAGQVRDLVRRRASCRSTPGWRRGTARRGRASGTPGCCASSARRGRPGPTPSARRPAAARATWSAICVEGHRVPRRPRRPSSAAPSRSPWARDVAQELRGDGRARDHGVDLVLRERRHGGPPEMGPGTGSHLWCRLSDWSSTLPVSERVVTARAAL